MGSIGKVQKPQFSITTPGFGSIFSYRATASDKEDVANWLTNLGRPLKKNEFKLKSEYVGSRIQGGLQYGTRVVFPEGFHALGADTFSSQRWARKAISSFVDAYNNWYKQNGGK